MGVLTHGDGPPPPMGKLAMASIPAIGSKLAQDNFLPHSLVIYNCLTNLCWGMGTVKKSLKSSA